MKFTLSWLKEHLDTTASLHDIAAKLTAIGLEVESVADRGAALAPFIVAEIKAAERHPNADKLQVCRVFDGAQELQIVCGAPNARPGLKVVLATVGTLIPNGEFKIKASKIRDVESNGMLCSAAELNLGTDGAGIIELPAEAKAGEGAARWLGADDAVIEIAITPNRGDCLGVRGIARDLAAAGLGTLKPLNIAAVKGSFASPISVSIENKDKSPSFVGRSIRGVKNGQSPAWLKQRLEAIGQKSISALVDITNYLTFDLGRPAHVYDAAKLNGNLVVRDATAGEHIQALDGKTYTLQDDMTVIADASGPVAIGGIIGGEATGCTEATTDVFLEIALFRPIDVAMTGRALQIDSDARYRFERGVDAGLLLDGAERATALILELCGGEASDLQIAGTIPHWEKRILFNPIMVERRIGSAPAEKDIKAILERLGCLVEQDKEGWQVTTPSWRSDITGPVDLVEEIARIHGYEHIPAAPMPRGAQVETLRTPMQQRLRQIRRTLAVRGLQEVVCFSFISAGQAKAFASNDAPVVLENPISAELSTLRPSILPSLLDALSRNEARGRASLGLFEIGPVFTAATPEGQRRAVAVLRAGEALPRNMHEKARNVDIFDAKADALAALNFFIPADKAQITREVPAYYHPGRAGALKLGKQILGYFGELHPLVLKTMGIDVPVVACELFPDAMPAPKASRGHARGKLELSNFQAVERDFAFVVDENVSAAELEKAVRSAEKTLLEQVQIFDVYQGKGVEPGKKSVALSIRLQPKDKTLTDAEIEAVAKGVVEQVGKIGGVLRG